MNYSIKIVALTTVVNLAYNIFLHTIFHFNVT